MVKRNTILLLTILSTIMLLAIPATAGEHGRKHTMKKGILLVTFGTTRPEARSAFNNIEKLAKAAYPGIAVRWAYTSEVVRKKLAKGGVYLDSPEVALAKMMDEGFTHVAVQSLHTIAGKEFHDLVKNARAFAHMNGGFESVLVGYPLLGKKDDLPRVVDAIIKIIPNDRKKHEAVVLMGHGSPHISSSVYAAMMFFLQLKDPNIFVSTVDGSPPIEDITKMLLQKNIKKAYLMPFMSVAGVHAQNDMAGDEKDSWKSILTKAGIKCVPILKGTAEYDEIATIWIDHLGELLARFE
jgi:sirohydrochlorin cobaltochelatase